MSSHVHAHNAEPVVDREERGLGIKAVGFAMLGFVGIVLVFVPIGLRVGSRFWLFWVAIQGFIGMSLVGFGTMMEKKAAQEIEQPHGFVGRH